MNAILVYITSCSVFVMSTGFMIWSKNSWIKFWLGRNDNNFTSNNKLQNCDKLSYSVFVNMPVRFSQSVFSTCTDCVYTHTLPFCCILKLPLKHIRIQNVTYHLPFYYNLLLFIPKHFLHTLSYHPITDVTVLIQLLYE